MELTHDALADTRHAFDGVAATYHRENAANPIITAMRERTLARITALVPAGSALLDLGCGSGEDAEFLASRGYRVTALDVSPAMAREALDRMRRAGLTDRVQVRALDIGQIDRLLGCAFDAAYSDFGPLNCVPDLPRAAAAIGRRLRPGGLLVASVIGRICPWEIARYGLAGRWRRAGVRFSPGFVPVPLQGRTVWTRYYTPGGFAAAFAAAGLRTISVEALGLFTPPPYLQGFYARHPRAMALLDRLDRHAGRWPGLRAWGDHFLIAMTKG